MVLTASVLFPAITGQQIVVIMRRRARWRRSPLAAGPWSEPAGPSVACRWIGPGGRAGGCRRWPQLTKPVLSTGRKIGLSALRAYLAIAMILVIVKIIQVAIGH